MGTPFDLGVTDALLTTTRAVRKRLDLTRPVPREVLGIPSTVSQVALVPTAFYTGDTFRPGDRRPAEEVTYFNSWKQRS